MSRPLEQITDAELAALRGGDIRLAFFDIDGTVLSVDGHYPPSLKAELARIREAGVTTAIASGRPVFATRFLWEELGLDAPGLFCTGAHVFDPVGRNTLHAAVMPPAKARRFLEAARELGIYCELYTEHGFYIDWDVRDDVRSAHARHLRCEPRFADFAEVLAAGEPVYKFLIGADQAEDPDSMARLHARFPDLTFAYAGLPGHSSWLFASVIDSRACKRAAFEMLLAHHGVGREQVIAFGDSHSDREFLELAGTGVAMGNAREDVQACADFVTRPVWDDGLAYALRRLVP